MRHCPNCGNTLPPDVSNCPYCGAPCASHEVPPSPAAAQATGSAASAEENSTQRTYGPRYAPERSVCPDGGLTTAQYFWSLILFAIPVVGWIFLFYWAFGSHVEAPRKRLARAALMKGCVWLVTFAIAIIIFAVAFFRALDDLADAWYGYEYPEHDPFSDYYDAPFNLPDPNSDDWFYFEDPDFTPEAPSKHHNASCRDSVLNRRSCDRRGFRSRHYHKRGSCNSQYSNFHSGRCHW